MFLNPAGAPLVIYTAKTRLITRPDERPPSDFILDSRGEITHMPVVTLSNTTDRRIVAVKLRFKADADSHAVTVVNGAIEPRGTLVFTRNKAMSGSAREMKVQVLGVRFEDGSVWGSLDSRIDTRQTWLPVP